jgi:hypothetical protein
LSSHHLDNPDIPGAAAFLFSGNHEVSPFTQTITYSAAHVLFPACKTQDGLSPIFLVSDIQAASLPLCPQFSYSAVNGRSAIFRALLIDVVSMRWCLAQLPDIRRGSIFPRSVTYFFRRGTSL